MPLGSGALAGVAYPTDREFLARELNFSGISANSMDAVSDRDFVLEYLSSAATCMMHLSRMGEELVLWSSREFGFIRLAEEFTTGSSIMPQKRNPDFAELARGKTGRVYGNLMGLLTVMKGLPLTYNRDLQEDKEGFFDTVDTLLATLGVFQGMLSGLTLDVKRVDQPGRRQLRAGHRPGRLSGGQGGALPRGPRDSGRTVPVFPSPRGKELQDLSLEDYRRYSPQFDREVLHITALSSAVARDNLGGTAPDRVAQALNQAEMLLEGNDNGL